MNEHPEIETLQNYLDNSSSSEFSAVRLHIAQCLQCRTLVENLMNLKDISQQVTDPLTEHQHQMIDDYINDRLSANEKEKQKDFIDSNPQAMKAALHYASKQSAFKRHAKSKTISKQQTSFSSFWSVLRDKFKPLFSYQAPVWISAPATAAFVALISFSLYENQQNSRGYKIASYQDNAIIQFRPVNSLPGIGFFAKSENSEMHYNNVDITVTENRDFIIHWPAIEKAIKYNLRLQVFDQGTKKQIGNITTDKNSALITTGLENIYHRYEWVLTGETSDKLTFMANGGFVINNTQRR